MDRRPSSVTSRDLECMLCEETAEPKALPLSLLEEITDGFSDDQRIGSGGFAVVYKGKLENRTVAVKRMSDAYMDEKVFHREVECLMMVKHKNVVRFLGYCADRQGSMERYDGKFVMADVNQRLLCFEYLPKGSLDNYITDVSRGLPWRDRYQIVTGICQGLHYLHQKNIVHLDLKPANILLDDNLVPKITDFGISRCFHEFQSRVITTIAGSLGYLAPESFNNTKVTYRQLYRLDIYSLGVVITEILTGERGYHDVDNVVESWSNMLEKSESNVQLKQIRVCAEIGVECIDSNPAKRPDTENIINRLNKYIEIAVITSQQAEHAPYEQHQDTPNMLGEASSAYPDSIIFTESSYRKKLKLIARVKKQDLEVRVQEAIRLQFVGADSPRNPAYTGSPVRWENGENAKVAICRGGKQIMGGDLSKLQIEILPVHSDFFTEQGQEGFTEEEFNKQIHMYKGKESVLTTVTLENGEAYLDSIIFTESSYRKKLRLTARVKRQDLAVRVQEAISDPFVVKDRRNELNEKSYLPSKGDAVHQLKKISQKGKRFIALEEKNITTVKHLMRQYHKDKSGLQKLTGMKKGDWSTMINHASTCDPGDEIYSYRVAEENFELLFNDLYALVGTMINGLYVPVRELNQFQQLKVNNWKMSAYKKFEERENSEDLIPDYLMFNGRPVCAVPLNNDAGPSVQATTIWPYPGASLTGQQNGHLSSLTTDDCGTSCPVTELGQHDPSMPQNGTPFYPTHENILNGQGPFSGQPTVPFHNFLPVPEDNLITGANNGYLNSLTTDAPDLGQHHACMSQNGTPYCPTQRNILNDQGSFSG